MSWAFCTTPCYPGILWWSTHQQQHNNNNNIMISYYESQELHCACMHSTNNICTIASWQISDSRNRKTVSTTCCQPDDGLMSLGPPNTWRRLSFTLVSCLWSKPEELRRCSSGWPRTRCCVPGGRTNGTWRILTTTRSKSERHWYRIYSSWELYILSAQGHIFMYMSSTPLSCSSRMVGFKLSSFTNMFQLLALSRGIYQSHHHCP